MKRLFLLLLLFITTTSQVFADNAAKIRIKISGATSDNRYFLCMSNVGCLSILGAQRGKVFPIYREIVMSQLYVTDNSNRKLSPQGLPASCRGNVDASKTLTITGHLAPSAKGVKINGLHCSVT